MIKIGIAADHAGFELKKYLIEMLYANAYEVIDYGNTELDFNDDYPDYVLPLGNSIRNKSVTYGIAICGSGVGACIIANKIAGIRACLIHERFSAKQGVEDDNMNMICLGGRVVDNSLAWELAEIFINAKYSGAERHARRLAKITAIENSKK